MSVESYGADRISIEPLIGKRVSVIGYGNQGHAHALNLRDSGVAVLVGQRSGLHAEEARRAGFEVVSAREAARRGDLVIMALPDETAAEIYEGEIHEGLRAGSCLGFIHGFNIHFGLIHPPGDVDVVMIAPKGPGTLLRSLFVEGRGLPVLLAVERDASGNAERMALGWAAGVGAGRAAVIKTQFATETITDLFGEQAVLCGGVTALVQAAFDTLVGAGYPAEFAYLECVHELKQIVDLVYGMGIRGMRRRISNTAEYGDLSRGPRLVSSQVRQAMNAMLAEIQSGRFAHEWMDRYRATGSRFREGLEPPNLSALEQAGEQVRRWMPWLSSQGS